MKLAIILLPILLPILLSSCSAVEDLWGASDCSDDMKNTEKQEGKNYTIRNFDADGYHNEIWYYSRKYVSFTWGSGIDNCEVARGSTSTFQP